MFKVKQILVIVTIVLLSSLIKSNAQSFSVSVEPIEIKDFKGIQSFAYAEYNNMWLIVGGRLDGLHRRQPWATFDIDGHNTKIFVIDPINKKSWSVSISNLPQSIKEQMSSTNMQFYQRNDFLYCIGGYGFSEKEDDHTTYSNLTVIKVPALIDAIINKKNIENCFNQIKDTNFQVTGGKLQMINDTFYLMGGQKFIGRYNPMGPDHGPGFVQQYSNSIKVFTIQHSNNSISVNHIKSITDSVLLHKRDYNAEPQILTNGSQAIIMFSGVFKQNADLPHLEAISVTSKNYSVIPNFKQYYNHYHCAVLPIYLSAKKEMHNIFFGGIAQFYDSLGILTQDDNVPFVKTISSVCINEKGEAKEYLLKNSMPAYLGSGAEFIPLSSIPKYSNGVIMFDSIKENTFCVGYIVGGIKSSNRNIFWDNEGNESVAEKSIYKVIISRNNNSNFFIANVSSFSHFKSEIKYTEDYKNLSISNISNEQKDIKITVLTEERKPLKKIEIRDNKKETITIPIPNLKKYASVLIEIESNNYLHTRRIIINQ